MGVAGMGVEWRGGLVRSLTASIFLYTQPRRFSGYILEA